MSSLIKPLFRLTVVAFMIAVLMPVTTGTDFCHKHPGHKKCPGEPPPPPEPLPTNGFTVEVFFSFGKDEFGDPIFVPGAVPLPEVVGKIQGNRRKVEQLPITVIISTLNFLPCTISFSDEESASFTLHTARIPPSSTVLTFVSPAFGAIMPPGQEESFDIRFDGGAIDTSGGVTVDDWFPAAGDTTSLIGDTLTLIQTQSPTDAVCNLAISQIWKISVKNNDPAI